jgi:hypothetical protein
MSILCLGIVWGVSWFSIHQLGKSEEVPSHTVVKQYPIVHNISEEPVTGNGTLGDAIHNTQIFLDFVLEKGQVKTIDFQKNKESLSTVTAYEKGAISFTNKVNASQKIKSTLKNSLDKTKTAIANQDYNSLYQVDQNLLQLDKSYNGNN